MKPEFELRTLTSESSFTEYSDPEHIIGHDDVENNLFEEEDYDAVVELDVGASYVDSEDNRWTRIR
jgi:hypothetical protein